ncbi:WXG100 family type VII secretion target [Nocardia salmonicida]|uniref:WXG100 family type VII secretion target n=1 Tax=Nocardia salmonicida TaxID=53431 RepID=UPI0036C00FC7
MSETEYDVLGIDKQSQNFEQVHGVLASAIANIDDETRNLVPRLWEGDAATAFVELIARYQEKAQQQQNLLMEASGLLGDSSKAVSAQDDSARASVAGIGAGLDLP